MTGEFELTNPPRGLTKLVTKDPVGAQTLRSLFESVPGYYGGPHLASFPADPRAYEMLVDAGLSPGPAARAWYAAQLGAEAPFAEIARSEDALLCHPRAAELRPYQRVGAQLLAERGHAILADEMGLGKTVETIVAVETSRHHANILVICPNALKGTWRREVAYWSGGTPTVTVAERNTRRKQMAAYTGGWWVANYELLVADCKRGTGEGWAFYQKPMWDWVIVDEAHRARTPQTATFRALKGLRTRRLALLTGTPRGNNNGELWALLHLVDPKRYPSYWRFFNLYVDYNVNYFGAREIRGGKNEEYLRRDLATVMLMRKKEDVARDLPPKVFQVLDVPLHRKQAPLYRQMLKELRVDLDDGDELSAPTVLAQLTRLRQILSTPQTIGMPDDSGKLDAVLEIVGSTEARVLVFSMFRETVLALCRRLAEAGVPHTHILGGMSTEEVSAAQDALNGGAARVLAATIQAGGVGLTLTGASTVVFVEEHWNPMLQQQATDRSHRLGQTQTVHVITLRSPGTVDDQVGAALWRKLQSLEKLLGRDLREALHDLFTAKPAVD